MHLLSPLEFERSALRGVGRRPGVRLHCCGPGAERVAAWAARAGLPAGSLVVLVGVAGALAGGLAAGAAVEVSEVVGAGVAGPSLRLTGLPLARAVSVAAPLADADEKRAERARSGADVVDMESAAFAREAMARGWRWTIVRGISDGALDALPAGVAGWTDADGRTRAARVAVALLRRPALARDMARLGARSRRAMAAVARALDEAIGSTGASDG